MNRFALFAMRGVVATAGLLPWLFAFAGERPDSLVHACHGFCHQLPERTLALDGVAMLVCSRCAGIYAGVALGALLPPLGFLCRSGRLWVAVAALLMGADVAAQQFGWMPVWHPSRLATGLFLGLSISAFVFAVLSEERGRREVTIATG